MFYNHLFGFEVKSLLWKLLPLFENSLRVKMLQTDKMLQVHQMLQTDKILQAHHTENTSCGSDSGTYWVRFAKLKFLVWTASWSFCNGQPPTWSFYHSQPPSCVHMWSFYNGLPPTSGLSRCQVHFPRRLQCSNLQLSPIPEFTSD